MRQATVTRREFIAKFMHDAGLTYYQACGAYRTMLSLLEDSMVRGDKVILGHVGGLHPVRRPARAINMGFARVQGGVVKTRRIYHLDARVDYMFRFHRKFKREQMRG